MNLIQTELSSHAKQLLENICENLDKINIPTTWRAKAGGYHSLKTGTTTQRGARQTSFGLVRYRGQDKLSKSSMKYPHIMPLFAEFIESHYPGFKYTSIYVNKNTVVKKHLDSKNTGESLLVGCCIYTGGKTVLYDDDTEYKFDINSHSLIFNGSKIVHSSEPFVGTRYSFVFF